MTGGQHGSSRVQGDRLNIVSQERISMILGFAMEDADERGKTIAFPFTAHQVVRVYCFKEHPDFYGDGLWFQLADGAIFNCLGEREKVRKSCFKGAVEGQEARAIATMVIAKLDGFKGEDHVD